MTENFVSLNEADKKRVLDTLDFINKHPETGYKEVLSSEYVAGQFRELGYAPLQNDKNMIELARRASEAAYPENPMVFYESYGTGSTDMGDMSVLFPSVHPYAPGATGTGHGDNYRIADPDLACVKSAEWQLNMLYLLLSDGAKEGKRNKEEFTPMFASKEEYFEYIEKFYAQGNRIEYSDGEAKVMV